MKRAGIGSHTKQGQGETVIWLTPPDLLEKLGVFELDPCSAPSPRPWNTALKHIELPQDGLKVEWDGRVWLNPPYDKTLGEWMRRMGEHGSGIALIFARTETEVWQELVFPKAHSILFICGRLTFRRPDGSIPDANSGGPSALISYSEFDTYILRSSGIKGSLQQTA